MRSWGEPPWSRTEVPVRPLEDSTPEVAIIGGGLTGVSAAYHLARRGVRAVLLEAGRLGDGASGRTGGIVLEGTARGILDGADRCGPALEELVSEARIGCDLKLPGCWEIEHQSGADGEMLPWKDDGVDIRVARTVVGGTVDPMALLTGLARAATEAGAIVHERAEVRRLAAGPHPVLELAGATVRPRAVIVAVNAWTSALLPKVRRVRSALTFACATAPLDDSVIADIGLGPGIPFYTLDVPYLWGRVVRGGQVIFGAGLSFGAPRQLERLAVDAGEPREVLAHLEARVRGLHRALREVPITHRWAGPIAIPQDMAPLVGRLPGAPALLIAGGYSGHGVALSVWMGRLLACAISDGEPLPPWGRVSA